MLQNESAVAMEDAEERAAEAIVRDAGRDSTVLRVLRRGSAARTGAVALPPSSVGSDCETSDLGLLLGPAADGLAWRETRSGRWMEKDCFSIDRNSGWADRYEGLYGFELFVDAEVEISLRSTDAGAYLALLDPSGGVVWTDDGGDRGDTRISTGLAARHYWVAATTYGSGAPGGYQLAVRAGS